MKQAHGRVLGCHIMPQSPNRTLVVVQAEDGTYHEFTFRKVFLRTVAQEMLRETSPRRGKK